MKRKRKLKSFSVVCGIHNDDFMNDMRTLIIYYTLAGQTKRRAFTIRFQSGIANHIDFHKTIYYSFKTSLNIKHT